MILGHLEDTLLLEAKGAGGHAKEEEQGGGGGGISGHVFLLERAIVMSCMGWCCGMMIYSHLKEAHTWI